MLSCPDSPKANRDNCIDQTQPHETNLPDVWNLHRKSLCEHLAWTLVLLRLRSSSLSTFYSGEEKGTGPFMVDIGPVPFVFSIIRLRQVDSLSMSNKRYRTRGSRFPCSCPPSKANGQSRFPYHIQNRRASLIPECWAAGPQSCIPTDAPGT
jgi:hypothetical protein